MIKWEQTIKQPDSFLFFQSMINEYQVAALVLALGFNMTFSINF